MRIDLVISQITTYLVSISKPMSVYKFGTKTLPTDKYIVIKQEPGLFRIITHLLPGQESALELLVWKDIYKALYNKMLTNSITGESMWLTAFETDLPQGIVSGNDDGTISLERVFRIADTL